MKSREKETQDAGRSESKQRNNTISTYDLYGPVRNAFYVAASITWASGRGLGPENREFLDPVKWHRADRRVLLGDQKTRDFQGPTLATWPSNGCVPHQKHYAWGPYKS